MSYVRVSRAGQVDGLSLDDQEDRARAWAEGHGYEVVEVFADRGASAWRNGGANRPAFAQAMDAACEVDALVVYNLTRFGRSVPEIIQNAQRLERAGTDLVSLSENLDTTSAAGKAMFGMLAIFAQFFSDQKSEQMTEILAAKRERGECVGTVPFGWKRNGKMLVPHEGEQAARERVLELRASGLSLRAVAEQAEAEGLVCRTRFSSMLVKRICDRG